jgi:enoyl-CoA hydratase/carnithine racemase
MLMEKAVLYQKKEAVAWITLNRPQSLNSMNDILVEELHAALDEAAADEGIRSIIITVPARPLCRRRLDLP